MKQLYLSSILLFVLSIHAVAQDSLMKFPRNYLSSITLKCSRFENKLNSYSEKTLNRLIRHDRKMKRLLSKVDPKAAENLFHNSIDKLGRFEAPVGSKFENSIVVSSPYEDTIQNTLCFLRSTGSLNLDEINGAISSFENVKSKLQQTEQIKNYINERRDQLKQELAKYTGLEKKLKRFDKQAYYYSAQLKEYKSTFEDPKKAEKKALEFLKKVPAYNKFMEKHALISSLFALPIAFNTNRTVEGLQTRNQIEQLISERIGSNPITQQMISAQMNAAKSKFDELKSDYPQLDNASEMPDFRPNNMKIKTLWKRLEPGGNIQFQKSSRYFPTAADIAVQLAYQLRKNGSFGLGVSYKLGMGNGWNDISFSHRGVGFRSFLDWKLKGSFFINGGYEINRGSPFSNLQELKNWNGWQRSALIGLCKKYKINPKLKGNIMVLYDFLAPRQLPKSDNIKLRFGYTL